MEILTMVEHVAHMVLLFNFLAMLVISRLVHLLLCVMMDRGHEMCQNVLVSISIDFNFLLSIAVTLQIRGYKAGFPLGEFVRANRGESNLM
jgi:hypothetical protein